MEKILILIDQKGLNKSAFEFACYLANLTRSTITAIFLDPEGSKTGRDLKAVYTEAYTGAISVKANLPEEHWKTQLAENRRSFSLACSNRGVRWSDDLPPVSRVDEIITETRFADILIVNAESSPEENPQSPPSEFIKDILVQAECPVVVSPLSFTGIEEILFAYDGSASAVYAMKQFTYLFPQLSDTKTIFLEVGDGTRKEITNHEKIKEYLKKHYSAIGFHLLHGKASDELFGYLLGKKNVFVVAGAYGRTMLSTLFKRSTAEILLQTTNLPIFIAHR